MSESLIKKCNSVTRDIVVSLVSASILQIIFIVCIKLVAYQQPNWDNRVIYVMFTLCCLLALSVFYNACMVGIYSITKIHKRRIYYSSAEAANRLLGVPDDNSTAAGAYWIYGPYGGKHFIGWR